MDLFSHFLSFFLFFFLSFVLLFLRSVNDFRRNFYVCETYIVTYFKVKLWVWLMGHTYNLSYLPIPYIFYLIFVVLATVLWIGTELHGLLVYSILKIMHWLCREVKCYDNKIVKSPFSCVILLLTQPQVANQQKDNNSFKLV